MMVHLRTSSSPPCPPELQRAAGSRAGFQHRAGVDQNKRRRLLLQRARRTRTQQRGDE